VTAKQRSRRPIFIATLRAGRRLAVFLRCSLDLYESDMGTRSRLEKQPTDLRQNACYFGDRTLETTLIEELSCLPELHVKAADRLCTARLGSTLEIKVKWHRTERPGPYIRKETEVIGW
jgi:hypothetical protein